MDANRNTVTNASGYVTQWYDARETSAAAVNYGYAEALSDALAGTANKITVTSTNGRPAVSLGAYIYRHNGAETDPTEAVDGQAYHVCEFSAYNSLTVPIDAILRDRIYASGGAFIHEFLIFTRRLTRLFFLSPTIIEKIAAGELRDISVNRMIPVTTPFWTEQERTLGI